MKIEDGRVYCHMMWENGHELKLVPRDRKDTRANRCVDMHLFNEEGDETVARLDSGALRTIAAKFDELADWVDE